MAAIIAGAIALFAPCCISVMLPAYFASSFQNRRVLVAMTFVFAAGIAGIVLPIAMGASLIQQVMITQHTLIYAVGGGLMLLLGCYVLLGGQLHLPMPTRRASSTTGIISVYTLGLFSGVASSCCAPVLAGVIALSSVASSFALALLLGTAYVFGMVAPLFVIALLWEHYDWRASHLFHPRPVTLRLGPVQRTLTITNLASGILLLLIGAAMGWIGLTASAMPQLSGWQAQMAVTLQQSGLVVTSALSWLPNWAGGTLLLLVLGALAWYALRQTGLLAAHEEEPGEKEIQEQPFSQRTQEKEQPVEH
jgi:cytochrome c biogenesis protein CcdA